MKIAVGAAKGLAFLHEAEQPVIFRDFKASNILLDSVRITLHLLFDCSIYRMIFFICTVFSVKKSYTYIQAYLTTMPLKFTW